MQITDEPMKDFVVPFRPQSDEGGKPSNDEIYIGSRESSEPESLHEDSGRKRLHIAGTQIIIGDCRFGKTRCWDRFQTVLRDASQVRIELYHLL